MNLVTEMQKILEAPKSVNLFFALKKNEDKIVIKKADLEVGVTQDHLVQQFCSLLEEDFVNSEEIYIKEMSEADERGNVFYHYDLPNFPISLQYFKDFQYQENCPIFSFKEDDLMDLDALIIVLGNQEKYCVLYKKFYPVFLLGRGSYCLALKKKRFEKFEEEVIRINRNYQFLMINNEIFIKDLKVLEKYGGFRDIIVREAELSVEEIEKLDILEETEVLSDTIKDDVSFARRLCKLRQKSPVIEAGIPSNEIIEFSKTHPGLAGQLKYNETGEKILLTTKKSKQLFLKMLDDSYLVSELTKQHYASLAKENVERTRYRKTG